MKTFAIASTYGWLLWAIACSPAIAKPEPVMPTLVPGSAKVLANVTDPAVSRDSCGSRRLGNRVLWVCRDTSAFNSNGTTYGGLVPNSASWSDIHSDNTPVIVHNAPAGSGSNGSNAVLQLYGGSYHAYTNRPFYPLAANEDAPAGFNASAHTRFAVWPGQPPMIANSSASAVSAYTWINQNEIYTNEANGAADGKHVTANQPTSLYRLDFNTDASATSDVPPTPTLVDEAFWPHDTWGYGSFLSFVNGTTAYLFANNEQRTETALAKVQIDKVEDISSYQYYVNGAWTKKRPSLNDSAAYIPNLGGGLRQGTVYWSTPFQSFIYIGQDANQTKGASKTCGRPTNDQAGLGCLEFFISTAPNPEGPWVTPYSFYSVPKGNGTLGAYSVQAHPAYVPHPETNKAIYITYTQRWSKDIPEAGNVHPLIYLELE